MDFKRRDACDAPSAKKTETPTMTLRFRTTAARAALMTFTASLTLAALCADASAAGVPPLADRHAKAGVTCADCHGTAKPEPMAEVEADKCLACHPKNVIVGKYKAMGERNPHENHLGDVDCSICHKGHEASVSYCANCHQNFTLNIR